MGNNWGENVKKSAKSMYPIHKSFSEKDKIVLKKLQDGLVDKFKTIKESNKPKVLSTDLAFGSGGVIQVIGLPDGTLVRKRVINNDKFKE